MNFDDLFEGNTFDELDEQVSGMDIPEPFYQPEEPEDE